MTILFRLLVGIICGMSSAALAVGPSFTFPQGQVELLQSEKSLGLHFKMAEQWHIYWKNSGDSGAAPKWNWTVQGGKMGEAHWPAPERITVDSLTNLGYSNETLFIFDLVPDEDVTSVVAEISLEFLICKIECIPYFTNLRKEFPYSAASGPPLEIFKKFSYSEKAPANFSWTLKTQTADNLQAELTLPSEVSSSLKNLEIFPEDGEVFKPQAPELTLLSENRYELTFLLQDNVKKDLSGSQFLLVTEDKQGLKKSYEVVLTQVKTSFATILLWALIGGFILNFMPCVFPVLSIKILSFLGPDKDRKQLKVSGIFYTFGVLFSFLALGGLLLILRASGEQIGWGFQLQSPGIAAGIAVLFFWLGLNFLGVFEIGQSLSFIGSKKTSSDSWGSFFTGVLATIVATPCTAPFMGAALGASLTLPAYATLVVFAGLGLGMALPFLLLAYFPQGLRFLPKPGLWMQRLKEFLAFPLFATVLWLLWVLSQQLQADGVLFVLVVFVLVGFLIWFAKTFRSEKAMQALLVLGFLLSLGVLHFLPEPSAAKEGVTKAASNWLPFTKEAVTGDIQNNKAVFIDFTAAWCITCQLNKKAVLNTEDIQQEFKNNNVTLYKADWTDRNPLITQALAEFGRNSLPLYVYYPAGSSKPQILPEILTKSMIQNLFNKEIQK